MSTKAEEILKQHEARLALPRLSSADREALVGMYLLARLDDFDTWLKTMGLPGWEVVGPFINAAHDEVRSSHLLAHLVPEPVPAPPLPDFTALLEAAPQKYLWEKFHPEAGRQFVRIPRPSNPTR